jgi:hypothetical protein
MNTGDTSLFHIHSTPSLFISFADTKSSEQKPGQEWIEGETKKGEVAYIPFDMNGITSALSR